jgi:hypothetical protein
MQIYRDVSRYLHVMNSFILPRRFVILGQTMPGVISFFKLIMSQWFLKKGTVTGTPLSKF